jgi:hypothetical protein
LDRIDYNIERALEHVTKGKDDIVAANEHSKKGMTLKCILVLVFLLVSYLPASLANVILCLSMPAFVDRYSSHFGWPSNTAINIVRSIVRPHCLFPFCWLRLVVII